MEWAGKDKNGGEKGRGGAMRRGKGRGTGYHKPYGMGW